MNSLSSRLKKIQSHLKANHIDLAIVSLPADISYLTHIAVSQLEREAMLYISPSECVLLHSPLLIIEPNPHFVAQPARTSTSRSELLAQLISNPKPNIGIQEIDLKVSELKSLQDALKQATFIDISSLCTKERSVKSSREIATIRKAGSITAQVIHWVLGELGVENLNNNSFPNVLTALGKNIEQSTLQSLSQSLKSLLTRRALTEIKLAQHIGMALSLLGSSDQAFPVHVAFDEHTASPHHQPGSKVLKHTSIVMLDFGAKVEGYCADMTRTVCLSPTPLKKFSEIKKVVDLAYQQACAALSDSDSKASQVDKIARNIIAQAGYGEQFPHSTGHGVGLAIHEQPSLSPSNHQTLQTGMVVTIEPGIYIKNQFGYRIEDTLAVT